LEDTLELSGLGMVFEELEILAYQAMGEAGGDTDLINGEAFLMEQDDPGEVLDVALNGGLRVVCSALDVGEQIAGQIQIKDLGFVSLTAAHLVTPAA
jgi:hypothetical protein